MKRLIALGLLALGIGFGLSWVGPKANANSAAVLPVSNIPDVQVGDNVRVCLDRGRSGDFGGWAGGVVKSVDAMHITVTGTVVDSISANGITTQMTRPVERWLPMSSVLYIEKMLDGKSAELNP